MKNLQTLHRQAMDLARKGSSAADAGNAAESYDFYQQAYDLERSAASELIPHRDAEPTRSVLLRSAASLAIQINKYNEAEWLINEAYKGNPAIEIVQELKSMSKKLSFYSRTKELQIEKLTLP